MSRAVQHKVLVVEDDDRLRETLVRAVQGADDLVLAGQAADLPEARRLLSLTRPKVLLVDIGLPSGSGIDLIREANLKSPPCNVMVVTVFGDETTILACIDAGATGYLLKGARPPEIVEQIRALLEGGSPVSPAIARRILTKLASPAHLAEDCSLSAQEKTVLQLSSKGYTYEEIAKSLGLSRHTVGTYVKRAYRKLQVHGKTEAVYEARKLGLMRD